MLPTDPKSVADEIRAAEATAALHHKPIRRMIEQYSGGKWFRDDLHAVPTPENHVFAYVDWMEPQLAYAAPGAIVEANWEKSHGEVAKWMEACQRRAVSAKPITDDWRLFVLDVLFGYGVLKVGTETVGDAPCPFVMHVPVDQFGMATGPGVNRYEDSPLAYHRYDVDLDDLATMRDVDPAALAKVQNTYDPAGDRDGTGVPGTRTGDRKRCRVYDVWLAKSRQVCTLLSAGGTEPTDVFLRPPRPWAGPQVGPFVVAGLKRVPGSPYFMSPLSAVMQQLEAMNAHLRADAEEADSLKTFWAVDAATPEAGKAIEEAKSNAVVYIPGLRQGVVQKMDVGGVHPNRLEHTARMLERVERFLAMGDVVQGISNSDTATANDRAFKSANVRVEFARSICNTAAATAIKAQMWYRFNDPAYEERISYTGTAVDPTTGQEAPQQQEAYFRGGTEGGFYRGEFFPPQVDLDWERDFTVTVDLNSTSHTSDQQKLTDAMTLLEVQQTAYQMLTSMPGADVEYVVDRIGEAMNVRNLFKSLFTPQMLLLARSQNLQPPVQVPAGASPAMGSGVSLGAGPGRAMLPPASPGPAGAAGGMASPQAGRGFGGAPPAQGSAARGPGGAGGRASGGRGGFGG